MEERREISQKELNEMIDNCNGKLILKNIKMHGLIIENRKSLKIMINNCEIQRSKITHLDDCNIEIVESEFRNNYIDYSYISKLIAYKSNLHYTTIRYCHIHNAEILYCDIDELFVENSRSVNRKLIDKEGNNCIFKILQYPEYAVNIKGKENIKVGCQEHSLDQWMSFSEEKIYKMDGEKALDFFEKTLKPLLIETFGL